MLYAIIGMLVIIADQWIKFWVAGHIIVNEEVQTIIPGILSLVNVHNDGAAFGFLSGSGARIPFIILAGVFAVAVIIALATKLISGKLARWSIVLVTAGGLSNCLDRVIYGYVQDMFKFDFINFPVFNLADVFITVFAILFALAVIFGKTRKDDEEEDFFDEDEEEEEEEAPRVSRRKQRREKRRAAALEEEEEEDEEDEPAPVKKPRKLGRKARKAAEEEAEEPAAPAPAPKKAVKQEDPFADWDRANAKANAVKARRSEVVAAASKPAAKPAARAETARYSAACPHQRAGSSGRIQTRRKRCPRKTRSTRCKAGRSACLQTCRQTRGKTGCRRGVFSGRHSERIQVNHSWKKKFCPSLPRRAESGSMLSSRALWRASAAARRSVCWKRIASPVKKTEKLSGKATGSRPVNISPWCCRNSRKTSL